MFRSGNTGGNTGGDNTGGDGGNDQMEGASRITPRTILIPNATSAHMKPITDGDVSTPFIPLENSNCFAISAIHMFANSLYSLSIRKEIVTLREQLIGKKSGN